MSSNPMQKMKRNSTLTGLIIGLMIGLILCAGVYVFLTKTGVDLNKGEKAEVYVLATNVKSGETIDLNKIQKKVINKEDVPGKAVAISSPVVSKIDLTVGTILTEGMLTLSNESIRDDLREQEYNMIALPTNLTSGDYIDVRLQLPNGGDYIVISKKKVLRCNTTTVWLNMCEEEIELMSNAIIEYYIMAGSKLYATTYTDPGLQTAAIGTYIPNETVSVLIDSNPNIKEVLNLERYADRFRSIRNNYINAAINENADSAITNIEKNMKTEIKNLKQSRELYFGALNSAN